MIRITWLQFRVQALVGVAALAVVAIVLAITGPSLHHLYTTVLDCHAARNCAAATSTLLDKDHSLQVILNVLVEVVPGLVGLFWGAPLVAREFETGTYRLAWTATTRTRWIAIKLAGIGLAGVALTAILSLIVTWWSRPLDVANATLFSSFDQRDVVPLGYAAFAFAVGVGAGLFTRKTVPAMATALVVFAPIRLVVARWVRPYLISPLRHSFPDVLVTAGPPPPGGQGVTTGSCDRRRRAAAQSSRLGALEPDGERERARHRHIRFDRQRKRPGDGDEKPRRGAWPGLILSEHHSTSPADQPRTVRRAGAEVRESAAHSRGGHLPARQALLAVAVVRARDLCRGRCHAQRMLPVVGKAPDRMISRPGDGGSLGRRRTDAAELQFFDPRTGESIPG
jgi:hypothetical protein